MRRVLAILLAGVARWVLRVALPLAGAAALLHSFPYRATLQSLPLRVEGTLFTRPGLSAETTLGDWVFPHLNGLPLGVHITPEDVDVLELARAAGGDRAGFAQQMQADAAEQVPRIATWLVGEMVLGIALGLLAAALNMSVRYLRGRPLRDGSWSSSSRAGGVSSNCAVSAWPATLIRMVVTVGLSSLG